MPSPITEPGLPSGHAVVVSRRSAHPTTTRTRAATPAPSMRGFAAPDPDLGVVVMRADYRPSPFGGWIAALGPEGTGPAQEHHFPDPHSGSQH